MNRPYIICHMLTSLDCKVTGGFLSKNECASAAEIYYRINRTIETNGFICGRVTMEKSFTNGWYPDLTKYQLLGNERSSMKDYISKNLTGYYAICFDTHGKLGWKNSYITDPDKDPGYDGAQIVEILSEDVDRRYLKYLESLDITYIFAGKKVIDVNMVLSKLKKLLGCEKLFLEGGSIINGAFENAQAIDELSLVVAPIIASSDSRGLFTNPVISNFKIVSVEKENDNLILNYKKI